MGLSGGEEEEEGGSAEGEGGVVVWGDGFTIPVGLGGGGAAGVTAAGGGGSAGGRGCGGGVPILDIRGVGDDGASGGAGEGDFFSRDVGGEAGGSLSSEGVSETISRESFPRDKPPVVLSELSIDWTSGTETGGGETALA